MPGTISKIQVAHDGALNYIRQYMSGQSGFGAKTNLGLQFPKTPVDRLVAYVNASLIDFFALGQEAVAKQDADTTNEHAIEDLIDVNYGIDESALLLKFSCETDKWYSVADIKALIVPTD